MADIPDMKKCCFYIPPRRGLLIWGYLNIILSVGVMGFIAFIIIESFVLWGYDGMRAKFILMCAVSSVVPLVDLIFNVILVVAGHKVNYKLFKKYYKYGRIRIAIYIFAMIMVNVWRLASFQLANVTEYFDPSWSLRLLESPCTGMVDILLQCYMMLVLRSYMLTLTDNEQLLPLNNETGADCQTDMDNSNLYQKLEIRNIKINMRTS